MWLLPLTIEIGDNDNEVRGRWQGRRRHKIRWRLLVNARLRVSRAIRDSVRPLVIVDFIGAGWLWKTFSVCCSSKESGHKLR